MSVSTAHLFDSHQSFEDFRNAVIACAGEFGFEREDMLALGEAYFRRYPDTFSNRNTAEVRTGYMAVRVCAVEKMLVPVPDGLREPLRAAFVKVSDVDAAVHAIVSALGADGARALLERVGAELAAVRDTVDSLPVGMTKERFVGGITHLFNVHYLLMSALGKEGAPR